MCFYIRGKGLNQRFVKVEKLKKLIFTAPEISEELYSEICWGEGGGADFWGDIFHLAIIPVAILRSLVFQETICWGQFTRGNFMKGYFPGAIQRGPHFQGAILLSPY